MINFIKAFLLVILFYHNAFAVDSNKQKPPQEITKNINNANLSGLDYLSFLGFKIYDIALWCEEDNFSYNRKFAINIKYNKSFNKDDLVKRSIVEMKKNYQIDKDKELIYKKEMEKVFENLEKGDTKTVIFYPQGFLKFYHNSRYNGKIEDKEFARQFVDIWLHQNSSYPKITMNLLGKKQ